MVLLGKFHSSVALIIASLETPLDAYTIFTHMVTHNRVAGGF